MRTRKEQLSDCIETLNYIINKVTISENDYENNFCFNVLNNIKSGFELEKDVYESRAEDVLDINRKNTTKEIEEHIQTKFSAVIDNTQICNSIKHYYWAGLCEGYNEGRIVGEKCMQELLLSDKTKPDNSGSQLPLI